MYKYTVIEQDLYKKAVKKLSKNYRNIESDVKDFLKLELKIVIKIKAKVQDID